MLLSFRRTSDQCLRSWQRPREPRWPCLRVQSFGDDLVRDGLAGRIVDDHRRALCGKIPFIMVMEKFANHGGMISEQLWDADDLKGDSMKRGSPTGAAMPLCWSHVEYISLVRSRPDGVCIDRVEPAFQRYVVNPVPGQHEIWAPRHRLQRMPRGKILRIILEAVATIVCQRMVGHTPTRLTPTMKAASTSGLQTFRLQNGPLTQ